MISFKKWIGHGYIEHFMSSPKMFQLIASKQVFNLAAVLRNVAK